MVKEGEDCHQNHQASATPEEHVDYRSFTEVQKQRVADITNASPAVQSRDIARIIRSEFPEAVFIFETLRIFVPRKRSKPAMAASRPSLLSVPSKKKVSNKQFYTAQAVPAVLLASSGRFFGARSSGGDSHGPSG